MTRGNVLYKELSLKTDIKTLSMNKVSSSGMNVQTFCAADWFYILFMIKAILVTSSSIVGKFVVALSFLIK